MSTAFLTGATEAVLSDPTKGTFTLSPLRPTWDQTALSLLQNSWDQVAFHATMVDVCCT